MMRTVLLLLILIPTMIGCQRADGLSAGVAQEVSPNLLVYPGAQKVRSAAREGLHRVTYDVAIPHPAATLIEEISQHLAARGWKPLRDNFYNRDETSEYVRGWVQYLAVDRPGGKERFLSRWWAQWRNDAGEIVDYSLTYLSPSEAFTNKDGLYVSGTWMTAAVAEEVRKGSSATVEVVELPVGTKPNADIAKDNSPYVRPNVPTQVVAARPTAQAPRQTKLIGRQPVQFHLGEQEPEPGLVPAIVPGDNRVVFLMPEAALDNRAIIRANRTRDMLGASVVQVQLAPNAVEEVRRLIRNNQNKVLALVVDQRVVSAPIIHGELVGDTLVIEGNLSDSEIDHIVLLVNERTPAN